MSGWSLYTATEEQITPELLRAFVEDQIESRLMTESMTLELKERRQGDNIARAVAAFANSDGGIVLVGLADENPSIENAPGVPSSEVVGISNSLRNLLTPPVRPMIVPVPLPERDRVIIVVRVDHDPSLVPVCKGGTVFVRAPGSTVPATRDQIIDLTTRSTSSSLGTTMTIPSLNSVFLPSYDEQQDTSRDALIRVAGGVLLRPLVNEFVFSAEIRELLRSALEASSLVLYPALSNPRWRRPDARPPIAQASFTAGTARFVVDYPENGIDYRVGAHFRRDGYRIAYALDLELRRQAIGSRTVGPRLSREELATSILLAIETVGLLLPDLIATVAHSAPQRLNPIHVWIHNGQTSLNSLLDTDRLDVGSENSIGSQWGWEQSVPRSFEDIAASLRSELVRLYLDIGLNHAEAVADEDVARGLTNRGHILSELIVRE